MIVVYAGETGGFLEIPCTLSGTIATVFKQHGQRQTLVASGDGTNVFIAKRYIGILPAGIYTLLIEGDGSAQSEDLHIMPTQYTIRSG